MGLAACTFNQLYGVAQLDNEVVTGFLETNREGDRVYVGTIQSGDRWNAVARVQAVDPATGTVVNTLAGVSGTQNFRAIVEDPADDSVWLLRDNGTLDHRTKSLGLIASTAGFFNAPSSGALRRFCDLEALGNGHFVATGQYTQGGVLRGFFTYVYPHPAFPGQLDRSWTSWAIDASATPDHACPRLSHENSTGEVVMLSPFTAVYGSTVDRYEVYTWQAPQTYYGLSFVDSYPAPGNGKYIPGDITSEFGYYIVASQHIGDANVGYLDLYELATGALQDSTSLYRARAVDYAQWTQVSSDASTVLWWGGRENVTGSSYELGVYGFAN